MGSASIGIKLADGSFFPILEEGAPASKVLELTTVRDDQTSVQINLFRGEGSTIEDNGYVGSLIIEDIRARASGEATIELTVSLDDLNELSAEAVDHESGSRQVLTVSLETLDNESVYSLPDFDLTPMGDSIQPGIGSENHNVVMTGTIPGNAPEGLYEMNTVQEEKSKFPLPPWLCIVLFVVGVLSLVLALLISARTILLNKSIEDAAALAPVMIERPVTTPVTETPAQPEAVPPPPVESTTPETPVVVVAETPPAPVQPEAAPAGEDIRYKIKWGDTLWDMADSYYRNPWLYTKIATYNKIRNPNLIIAGTWITIPAP